MAITLLQMALVGLLFLTTGAALMAAALWVSLGQPATDNDPAGSEYLVEAMMFSALAAAGGALCTVLGRRLRSSGPL
jgi:hypothetical protein